MELVKPVEPVLWASIVELVIGGTGYGTVEALIFSYFLPLGRLRRHFAATRN